LAVAIVIHFSLHLNRRNEFASLSQIAPQAEKVTHSTLKRVQATAVGEGHLHQAMNANCAAVGATNHVSRRASVKAGVNLANDIRRLHAMNASITHEDDVNFEKGKKNHDIRHSAPTIQVSSYVGEGVSGDSDSIQDAEWLASYMNKKMSQLEHFESCDSDTESEEYLRERDVKVSYTDSSDDEDAARIMNGMLNQDDGCVLSDSFHISSLGEEDKDAANIMESMLNESNLDMNDVGSMNDNDFDDMDEIETELFMKGYCDTNITINDEC
jgi:hypothetical protein